MTQNSLIVQKPMLHQYNTSTTTYTISGTNQSTKSWSHSTEAVEKLDKRMLRVKAWLTYHTAVAMRTSLWFLNGVISGSPTNKLPSILPAKHKSMEASQHDSGCFLENSGAPASITFHLLLIKLLLLNVTRQHFYTKVMSGSSALKSPYMYRIHQT